MSFQLRRPRPPTAGGGAAVARLTEADLRDENFPAVACRLVRLVSEPGRHMLRLDLSGVGFLTAGGLGKLVVLHRQLRAAGARLSLHNVPVRLYELFEVTRLIRLFDVRPQAAGRPT